MMGYQAWFWSIGMGLVWGSVLHAQDWALIGITGNKADNAETRPDKTLWQIDTSDASSAKLFTVTIVADTQSIGYNPDNRLLYHTAGVEAYTNDPTETYGVQGMPSLKGLGYVDSQYMETVNLTTREMIGVYNANPCPNPDGDLFCSGLDAPRPDWVLPAERRTSAQTGDEFRVRGANEFHSVRGMAWSFSEKQFYVAADNGIFRLTSDGHSTFVARPDLPGRGQGGAKSIAFINDGGTTRLLVGDRGGDPNGDAYLWEIDPHDGTVMETLPLGYPENGALPDTGFGGLLGLAQHPVTGVLYGVRKTDDSFQRELVTIDLNTGDTQLVGTISVGSVGLHIAGIAFALVGSPCDLNHDGAVDAADAAVMFADWGGPGSASAADKNRDGFVDAADAAVMFADWTGDVAVTAVPEPASWSALGLGWLALVRLRRRKLS